MATKEHPAGLPGAAPTPRLASQERVALQHLASAPKPWDGKRADSVPASRAALARLLALGFLRTAAGETLPGGVLDDTPLWVTPAGREALARVHKKGAVP